MLRRAFLFCFLVACGFGLFAQGKINWVSFEKALEMNANLANQKKTTKKIFVDVYTDWCGWCKRLDQTTFANAEIIRYMNENFIPVKLDAERTDTVYINKQMFVSPTPTATGKGRKGTHELAAILLKGQMSYPSCTFLDESGKQLDVIPGYRDAKGFEVIFNFYGSDAYKNTSLDDFQKTFVSKIKE